MARRKKKKSATIIGAGIAQSVTHAASLTECRESDVVAASDTKQKIGTEQSHGAIRLGVCLLGMLATLVLGLYVGSLLPSMMDHGGTPVRQAAEVLPTQRKETPLLRISQKDNIAQERQAPLPPMPPELGRKIDALEKLVLENPRDASHWIQLGNLYFDTEQPARAINAYERALALAPDNSDVLTDLGIMYREVRAFDKALASFRKASSVNPLHENAVFNEGVVLYYDLNRKQEARQAWENLLRINSSAHTPDGRPVKEMLRQLF